jgi:membrane protease YdiL (CAAX protease family)
MRELRSPAAAFLILAAPFYLNDIAFILLNGTFGVYLVDYGTRNLVLALCFLWPTSRAIATERLVPEWGTVLAVLCVLVLPVFGRLAHHLLEVPFVYLTGLDGLFEFPLISDPTLYWFDLTVGLLAVALSEELVFRKFALRWLEEVGRTPIQIVVISALFFSLMHWGSGPGRLLYTFVVGVIYMAAYLRLRRLWPLVLAHWFENFAVFSTLDP